MLGTIDGKVGQLTLSFNDVLEQLAKISDHVGRQEERILVIESTNEHKSLEDALSNMNSSMDNKLSDATAQFNLGLIYDLNWDD
ncbi:hypothetical protein EON64_16590, partial [archaeon]